MQSSFWLIPIHFILNPLKSFENSNRKFSGKNDKRKEEMIAKEEGKNILIKRITLDALKPREIGIIELSKVLCDINGIGEVDIAVTEVDVRTETIKIVLKGENINFDEVAKVIEDMGVVIRSVDEVNVRKE